MVPSRGASVSSVASSAQAYSARPTANVPVGVGNVTAVRCSNQSDPNNAATPRTPNIANTTKPSPVRSSEPPRTTTRLSRNSNYFI